MDQISIQAFHEASRNVDFQSALVALLREFYRGRIADPTRRLESQALATHLHAINHAWDIVFPSFPKQPWKRRTMTWEYHRGRRDAYLKRLITEIVRADAGERQLIVNPATVFGRHARWLAKKLPDFTVVATDLDPTWNRWYSLLSIMRFGRLHNYQFERENIFAPDVRRQPAVVAFWGACGAVTDGIMDYAIATGSPWLVCRTCCHDNIGGNTQIVQRPGLLNKFFAWKNGLYLREQQKRTGFYFDSRYDRHTYPRSHAARQLMDTETIIAIAQNSVDSDICRSLIDLDRCLYLQEHGYEVLYRDELFVARKVERVHDSQDMLNRG